MNRDGANLTIGCMITDNERYDQYTTSFPHYYTALVIANWPRRPFTSLERLMLPFDTIIWLTLVVLVLSAVQIIYFILACYREQRNFFFGRGNRTPLLNVFNIILGGAITNAPTRNFARTLLSFWIICTFVLRSSYQGALYSFLRSNRSAQSLDTLEKLVANNISIYGPTVLQKPLSENVPFLRKKYGCSPNRFNTIPTIQTYCF